MRLTTKGRFAVTAMIDVAMYGGGGPVTLAAVSLVDLRVVTRAPADTAAILVSCGISSDRCQPKRRT